MDDLQKLYDKLHASNQGIEAIIAKADDEKRPLSEDDLTAISTHEVECKDCETQIDKLKSEKAIRERLEARTHTLATTGVGRHTVPDSPGVPAELDSSRVNLLHDTDPSQFANFGEQLSAIMQAGCGNGVDERLAATGSNETTPSDGGFLVQQDFATEILKKTFATGEVISRVKKIPLSPGKNGIKINAVNETSRATGSRWGGVRVYRAAEAEQYTASRPKMRQIVLDLKKLIGLWYVTDELLADGAAMQGVAMDAFPQEFRFAIENEIIRGTGAGQMQGILNANCLVTVDKESGQADDTIVTENIDNMWARCWARSRLNSVWFYNQDIEPELANLTRDVGTGGVAVFTPPGGVSAAPFATIKGRPAIPIEYASTLGDKGDIMLLDLNEYITIDSGGPQMESSIHLRFDYGEQVFRWTMRNDGQPIWNSALTPFKGASNTQSPFVTLAARP